MRAELPWNVAGIPPEAREAARAAARREGLSVGEWLTRRILRSFSDLGEEASAMPYERATPDHPVLDRNPLDPWGMPSISTRSRDTEEMLSRVSRTEAESSEAYRRIEDHLRSVARRLDSAERGQSENNRAMNRTATDINLATREQAQAFDQLGTHVMSIGERLDRLERSAAQDGVKDAVKALQQGLTRLADQIGQTANQSAQQVSTISGNLEQMAERIGQLRSEAEATTRRLESRLVAAEEAAHGRLAMAEEEIRGRVAAAEEENRGRVAGAEEETRNRFALIEEEMRTRVASVEEETSARVAAAEEKTRNRFASVEEETRDRFAATEEEVRNRFAALESETARVLDQRLAAIEKASHFHANALDHALERLEAQASMRSGDQTELQKRHAETDGALNRLEESIERLESKGADPALDRRLDGIERSLGNLISRLDSYNPAAALEDTVRGFARRVETVEHGQKELQSELRANLAGGSEPVSPPPSPEPTYDPAIFDQKDFPPAETGFTAGFAAEDDFAAEKSFTPEASFTPETSFTAEASFTPETSFAAENSFAEESSFEAPPFAETVPVAESEDPPPGEQDPFASDAFANDGFPPSEEVSPEGENFLAAARRSARAAAEAEANRVNKMSFPWGTTPAANEASERPRYLVPAIIGGVLVLVLVSGIVLNQRAKFANPTPNAVTKQVVRKSTPAAPKPAPATDLPEQQQAAGGTATSAPANPVTVDNTSSKAAAAPAQPPQAGAKVPTMDRVTQLANGGNAIAQTIIGLKELDGDGVPANPADATKWLERAASQGQAVAQYRLGASYERGQGVSINPATATHWYQLAGNQGNRKAMHNLAVAYASGGAGRKDMAEAARWFAKAAALGLADSQFNLAVLYERGDGVPQSLLDAYKWYAIAAGQGDAESRTRLGVLSTQLSADDRSAAQKSADAFKPAPLNRVANIPPEMADLSGN